MWLFAANASFRVNTFLCEGGVTLSTPELSSIMQWLTKETGAPSANSMALIPLHAGLSPTKNRPSWSYGDPVFTKAWRACFLGGAGKENISGVVVQRRERNGIGESSFLLDFIFPSS